MTLNRRKFIRNSALVGAGGVLACFNDKSNGSEKFLATPETKSRIVIAKSVDLKDRKKQLSDIRVQKLLDRAVENFFEENAKTVWNRLFTNKDVVGLKVNALAGKGLSTTVELVEAISERLLQRGIPAKNIIIWDRMDHDLERAGFKINTSTGSPLCYGNDRSGFSRGIYEYGSIGSRLSRILTEQCTAIINLPILKDHGIVGVSVALKNFFGAIDNPNKYHDNIGDPYVADVNMLAPIREKMRLTICDAITVQYEGGPPFMPQWAWNMDSLMVATDMVAMDMVGWKIIEDKRKENGMPTLAESGRQPIYINTAGDKQHNLGICDMDRIEVLDV